MTQPQHTSGKHEDNENEAARHEDDDIGQWYTMQCIAHRLREARGDIRKGAIVELSRPTAGGTHRVFIDDIHGQTVRYSYGLGLLSEGMCRLSDIRCVMLPRTSCL